MELEKIEEWSEHTSISWQKDARIELNKVIRKYNRWVEFYSENILESSKLLVVILENLERYYCNQDGGSGYKEALVEMYSIVKSKLINIIT